MPKAQSKAKTKAARTPQSLAKPKDPKASHLYTDDNPATTIHGTGFKDAAAAKRTLELIKKRSLTYQWQTVNTMYHRAKHHPSMKKASSDTGQMKEAMEIFREWLDVTHPAEKAQLRGGGFKPLLSKSTLQMYMKRIQASDKVEKVAKEFVEMYTELPKGKRLGNVLVDNTKPKEPDWEVVRYEQLSELASAGKEEAKAWDYDELWGKDSNGRRRVTEGHLKLIAWAWSPVNSRELEKCG